MYMTDAPANPTDSGICALLATGPLPTRDLAERLGVPERTVRHRLSRLRQAGSVVTDTDGLHHLADPVLAAPIAGSLPARAAPAGDLADPVLAAPIAGGLPARHGDAVDRAAPVMAPDHPVSAGSSPRQGGRWRTGTVRAVVVVALAVAGGIAIAAVIRRLSPPSPPLPAPPMGFGYLGAPWGGLPW